MRTAPLVLDHGRLPVSVTAVAVQHGLGQIALLILLAIAFAAILVARLSGSGGDTGGILAAGVTPDPMVASATPGAATPVPPADGGAGPTLSPATAEPGASAVASETPSETGSPTEAPVATDRPTTYKVRGGDTLSGIAGTFGTTVTVLTDLNGIKDASQLRIGQILKLP